MIKILYFASLREQLDCGAEELELPVEIKDVSDLRTWLGQRGEQWQEAFDGQRILLSAVNQQMIKNININDGDEVAFFPPVTGG